MIKKVIVAAVIWTATFNILAGAAIASPAAPVIKVATITQVKPQEIDCQGIKQPQNIAEVDVKKPEVTYSPQGIQITYFSRPSLPQKMGEQIQQWISWAAEKVGIKASWLKAVALAESGGNHNTVSPAGAVGVMQLMPATAKSLGVNPYNPQENILGGAMYLRQQLDQFGNLPLALAAYNAGPGAVKQYGGIPPFKETVSYIARVMEIIGGEK
ncbi:lytic transglycosylase domain-containing protein [Moorella sp. ACPs]|uniref:lytic transglycosylase domain-containing protein n=1 Tax=Neomoorella carbonis TaxID=3062783 RepID=UPI0032478808